MTEETSEPEPTRRQWVGFWAMIVQQTQNAFSDKLAQFTLIPLGGAVAFAFLIPVGQGVAVDVPSAAGLMMALPMVLFAPVVGWVSDRFSKRDVMLGAALFQLLVLAGIAAAVMLRHMPLALCGFFALAVQSAFFSPAKIGINKELVGSKHLGFASGIQQMTSMLAILAGQILAGWIFDHRLTALGGGVDAAWTAALVPLGWLAASAVPALALALAIPRVPAQGCQKFSGRLVVSHFANLADLWRDAPLRRASFGVAFFWGFAAFINLWSVKLAQQLTGGGEGFGTMSSVFMAAASLGMAAGFGCASFLLRRRIELGWVPLAGLAMTVIAVVLAFLTPGKAAFLALLALLAFFSAVFLAPLNAWMQDRYPAAKRGELQAATNLQDCLGGLVAVLVTGLFEYAGKVFAIPAAVSFRYEILFIGAACGVATLLILRLVPGAFIRLVGTALIRAVYRIRAVGTNHVPAKGGALLLPNHVTFADAFFITAACPRPVRFVMDEVFMAKPAVRIFVSLFQTVTIRRDQPREAIKITIEALKNGDLVCLFPEGQLTRTGTLSELRRGFELIARKADHPLIPLWCDGAWGSVFSFERGRFFGKRPYRLPYGMTFAFGPAMAPDSSLEEVRRSMWARSAEALALRFEGGDWSRRVPRGGEGMDAFARLDGEAKRRIWINGHQIGQVNALQRQQPFAALACDKEAERLLGMTLAFADLFEAPCGWRDHPATEPTVWVGGDGLRDAISKSGPLEGMVFYDFGSRAAVPFEHPGVLHCPCLAVDGAVVAMSMPDPPQPAPDSEPQAGRKPGSLGKLLPGWLPVTGADGMLRVTGPGGPEAGLALPAGAAIDAEGFVIAGGAQGC